MSSYENTNAKALFADNDALVFRDYASEKLGIKDNKIKILINDGAGEKDILLAVKEWLHRSSKKNISDYLTKSRDLLRKQGTNTNQAIDTVFGLHFNSKEKYMAYIRSQYSIAAFDKINQAED